MALPRPTRWPIDPHTQAKHLILRRYLEAWLPIMARWNGRIHFLDGFAGPGRYEGGEEGSPLIAVRTLLDHPHFREPRPTSREVLFTFVEQRPDRAEALRRELSALQTPTWVRISVIERDFASVMTELLDRIEQRRRLLAPTFAFVDPFGFAGVPMQLMGRILRNPRCECLITFMHEAINRFLGHPDPAIQGHMDVLFGTDEWRTLLALPPAERRDGLVELYAKQLMTQARAEFVRTFEMINEGNRTEYFLFFATHSPNGLSKMKQAMWHADPVQGCCFSDRTDPRQGVLLAPTEEPLELPRILAQRFHTAGWVDIADVERFVLIETAYSEAIHLKRRTLAPMERDGLVEVRRRMGARERPGDYPAGTRIRFSRHVAGTGRSGREERL
jgi:three-Cys-motif partner protein